MKKKKLLLLLFLTILSCSSPKEEPIPYTYWDGWAGNPDNPNQKPYDYFYMKSTGRASQKAIDKKSDLMMKATCTDAATTKVKGDLIGRMLHDSLGLYAPLISNEPNSLTSKKELYFQFRSNPFNPLNLAAVSDHGGSFNSIVLFKEYSGKIKEVKVKECKPLYPDPEIPDSGWKECECIVYIHIPGGRDAIVAKATAFERK